MKQIVILGSPQRIDEHLVVNLQHLFPECELHIVDARNSGYRRAPMPNEMAAPPVNDCPITD